MRTVLLTLVSGSLTVLQATCLLAQQPTMTELVPQSASHSLVFRHVEDFKRRGDELSAELGVNVKMSALFSIAGSQLLVTGSANDLLPCGVMWFEPQLIGEPAVKQFWKKPVAAAVAISDSKKLAETLEVDHDQFRSGMIVERGRSVFGHSTRFFRMVGQYLWVVSHKKLYDVLEKARPLAQKIPRSQLHGIDSSDFLIEISASSSELNQERDRERAEKWIRDQHDLDPAETDAIREWFSLLYSASYAILTGTIDRGWEISLHILFDHDTVPDLRQRILKFSPPGEGVSLAGLPSGDLLFGHAARTDSAGIHAALTAVIRKEHGLWWPAIRKLHDQKFVTQLQQLKLLGLFGEIWPLTDRYKAAVYQEERPSEHGLISIAAILRTDQPDQLIRELESLASLVDRTALHTDDPAEARQKTDQLIRDLIRQLGDADFQKRQSATTRLVLIGEAALPLISDAKDSESPKVAARARQIEKLIQEDLNEQRAAALESSVLSQAEPVFIFHPDAERRSNASVEVIEVRLNEASELNQLLPILAGPEWPRIRLVRFRRHVAVFFGSNLDRFEQLITSTQAIERGNPVAAPETPYGTPLLDVRGAEFQGSFARVTRLVNGESPVDDDGDNLTDPELSSISVAIEPDFLAVEWRASLPDLKVLKKAGF